MNLDIINLVKLQQLDLRIAELQAIEAEGPQRMAVVEEELREAEEKVAASLSREDELQKRHRELESEITDSEEKATSNRARQLQAKNNEEYRALLKEAEYLKKSNSTREDEILNIMEELETLTEENKKLRVWLEEIRKSAAEKKREVEQWLTVSLADQGKLDTERSLLAKDLPRQLLSTYKRIYNGRNGRAVVPIIDGICQECHLQIPPQSYNELQRNQTILACPNCQRILYWKDHPDFEVLF